MPKSSTDAERPVIVYFADQLCDLSPRAVARLRRLGFRQVYDQMPGKADRPAAGMPREGQAATAVVAGDVADRNVPLCTVDQPLDDAIDMLDETGHRIAVVVDHEALIVGLLHHEDAAADPDGQVEGAMRPAVRSPIPKGACSAS